MAWILLAIKLCSLQQYQLTSPFQAFILLLPSAADVHDRAKILLTKAATNTGLPIPSLVCKLNGNSVATTFYPTIVSSVLIQVC